MTWYVRGGIRLVPVNNWRLHPVDTFSGPREHVQLSREWSADGTLSL